MFFFIVYLYIQFQDCVHLDYTFLPIGIRLHVQALMKHGHFHIRNHLQTTALAFHFLIKRNGMFQPLERIAVLIPPVQKEHEQLPFQQNMVFLRPDIQAPDLHRIPQNLCNIRLIGS